MNKTQFEKLGSLMLSSQKILILTIFFFVMGVSIGAVLEICIPSNEKLSIMSFLSTTLLSDFSGFLGSTGYFMPSFKSNLLLLAIIVFSGLFRFGWPVAFMVLIYKGMALGFSSALLIEALPVQGILTSIASILPQSIFLVPAFIGASLLAYKNKDEAMPVSNYLYINLMFLMVIALGCLLQSFIFPFCAKLIV